MGYSDNKEYPITIYKNKKYDMISKTLKRSTKTMNRSLNIIATAATIVSAGLLLTGCSTTSADNVVTPATSVTAVPSQYVEPTQIDFKGVTNNSTFLLTEGSKAIFTNVEGDIGKWEGKSSNELVAIFVKGTSETNPATLPGMMIYNQGEAVITLTNTETKQEISFKVKTEPLNRNIKKPAEPITITSETPAP